MKKRSVKCSTPGCSRVAHARGLCMAEYQAWRMATGRMKHGPRKSRAKARAA